ncbi:MAG TPA: glycosyltransferase [Acholeplasma sp.]|nr:glycosyltransferase [Acholeplasma sp.]
MIIVYVIDSYGEFSNGTTITAKRSKEYLEKLGHTVRIVSISKDSNKDFYTLEERNIPVVSYFAKKQNMHFAKPNKTLYKQAFKDADLVHLFLPYKSSRQAIKVAKKMNIPVTAAFHMQPEHITYGMGLDRFGKPLSWFIYKWLNFRFYKNVTHIHCPSEFIRNQLTKRNYKNVFHVISNGVTDQYFINPKREENPEIINILSIGRYSKEKRQDTLLKAVNESKYKDRIKITLAGRGPRDKKLRKLAKKYNLNVDFVFLTQEELIKTISESHLYVHPAEAEIEGISALEAIASGLVPIVAESKYSATSQFTLTKESLYKVRDYKELKNRIEYFIENPNRRLELEDLYRENIKKYEIKHSMLLMQELFKEAILDSKRKKSAKSRQGKKIKKKIINNKIKRFFSLILYYGIAIPIFIPYFYLIRGLRIKGKKNLKKPKKGAIIISNHVHKLDVAMGGITIFPKKPMFTSIPENLNNPFYGFLVRGLGATPIPVTPLENKVFMLKLKEQLIKGKYVHFFPEGKLITKAERLSDFKRGAFVLSEESKTPIIPIRINFIPKKRFSYPFFFKEKIVVNVGEPIYPNIHLAKRESITDLQEKSFETMKHLKIK